MAGDPERWLLWAKPGITWAWRLTELEAGRTRLVTRIRTRYELSAPTAAAGSVVNGETGG